METERERSKSAYEALLVATRTDSETRAQDMIKYVAQMRDELLQLDLQSEGFKAEMDLMRVREAERESEREHERARERQERESERQAEALRELQRQRERERERERDQERQRWDGDQEGREAARARALGSELERLRDASVDEAKARHQERMAWDEERRLWLEAREKEHRDNQRKLEQACDRLETELRFVRRHAQSENLTSRRALARTVSPKPTPV